MILYYNIVKISKTLWISYLLTVAFLLASSIGPGHQVKVCSETFTMQAFTLAAITDAEKKTNFDHKKITKLMDREI